MLPTFSVLLVPAAFSIYATCIPYDRSAYVLFGFCALRGRHDSGAAAPPRLAGHTPTPLQHTYPLPTPYLACASVNHVVGLFVLWFTFVVIVSLTPCPPPLHPLYHYAGLPLPPPFHIAAF